MKVIVGSKNPAKVDAVREILRHYEHLKAGEVVGIDVDTGVSEQPMSLEETVEGAQKRAKAAFQGCVYSIGIESGMMRVPGSKCGYMDVTVCAIYDGTEFHLGLSSAWEFPDKGVMDLVIKDGHNFSDAARLKGLTDVAYIGHGEGVISLATNGKVNRKEYTKEALRGALMHIDEFSWRL